jgi:single-strand DNA-binding protein
MPDLKMPSVNRIELTGRLTREVIVSNLASGGSVAKFGLAVNRHFKTKSGEKKEEAMFIDVCVWGDAGDRCKTLKKGYPVMVDGSLTMSEWTTPDGDKRIKYEVRATRVQALTWENANGNNLAGGGDKPKAVISQTLEPAYNDDDMPF